MTRSSIPTPRKSTARKTTPSQTDRVAKRLTKQQSALEKQMLMDMNMKIVPNSNKMPKLSDLKKISPMTDTQQDVFDAVADGSAIGINCFGSSGCGKSFLALYFALKEILNPESIYKRVVLVRSTAQTRQIGYLKGTEAEKLQVFEQPYINICSDLTGNPLAYEKLKEADKLIFMCSSFLRSMTFNDSIVIFDESQNTTFQEFSTVLTRLGKNSKIFVLGDSKQDDLTQNKYDVSGFGSAISVMNSMAEFRSFRFTVDDIVRSPFVKSYLIACQRLGL